MGIHPDSRRPEQPRRRRRTHHGQANIERPRHRVAPERNKRTSWRTLLKAHWGAIAAMDFFTVEAVTVTGLVRYFVLIVIDLRTRRLEDAGIIG